jgi:hypothetical protein
VRPEYTKSIKMVLPKQGEEDAMGLVNIAKAYPTALSLRSRVLLVSLGLLPGIPANPSGLHNSWNPGFAIGSKDIDATVPSWRWGDNLQKGGQLPIFHCTGEAVS